MAAENSTKPHWGEWLVARYSAIGFRRQKEVAAAIQCTENQLSRWVQMSRPPKHMRKGFDRKLAEILQVDRMTLFRTWKETSPEKAGPLVLSSDGEVPWSSAEPEKDGLIRLITESLWYVRERDLKKVYDHVVDLVALRNAGDELAEIRGRRKKERLPVPKPEKLDEK